MISKRPRHPGRTPHRLRHGFALGAIGIIGALAFTGAAAQATLGAKSAATCTNETVAIFGKPATLRFVVNRVSCATAHHLIQMYFHDATVKSCQSRGNICAFNFPGGWTCSLPLYAGEGGGDLAGCTTQHQPFETVRVYKAAAQHAGPASCGVIFAKSEGQNLNVDVERGQVSCTQARQIIRSFFSGQGIQHGGPSESALYWTLPGGWRCQLASGGGGGCVRGGNAAKSVNPPDFVDAYPAMG